MPKVDLRGIELFYQQCGSGPNLVMVHGLAANHAFWYLRIVPALASRFRVTVFDLRGHGLSSMPDGGYTTREMSEDLALLLDHLGLARPHVVGHSLGGGVALHLAARHPTRVARLVLVDCRLHALQPFRDPGDSQYWRDKRQALLERGVDVPDDTPKVVYMMLEELAPLGDSGAVAPWSESGLIVSERGWDRKSRGAQRWKRLIETTRFADEIRGDGGLTEDDIRGVLHPTLLSYGGDSFCLPTERRLAELLPHAVARIHPRLGHFFPVSNPERAIADITWFLGGDGATDADPPQSHSAPSLATHP